MEELDEIIGFLNRPNKIQLPPITKNPAQINQNQTKVSLNFKFLTFKPWSGQLKKQTTDYLTVQTIKEQIQGETDRTILHDDKEQFAQLSNAANDNQIGYFYKFQTGHVKLIKYLLDENGFKYANTNKNWTIYWSSNIIKNQIYQELLPYQKVNHFPNSFHLTRKDLMNKNISKMQAKFGGSHFGFLPKTYILPKEKELLVAQMQKYSHTYIVKPHNSSQGKGITVTSSLSVIESKLQRYSSLVVSHYIDNPLLINRLKFDLRIYVAITGVNPLRIYVYEDGLARFATQIYDKSSQDTQSKKFQHLTNYSINKKNVQFQKPSEQENQQYYGSKWSLTALKDFLTFNVGKNQTDELFERINDLIVKTILCGENILFTSFNKIVPYINSCFEVLGFDILIDSNLKPWLIEINMSPSMNTDSPLDLKIKGNMIADLLTMTGIVPLDQRYNDGGYKKYEIKNYMKSQMKRIEPNSPIDKFLIKMVEDENARSGKWNRVFPVRTNRYLNYFQVDRYYNRLLREGFSEPIFKSPFIIMNNTKEQKKTGSDKKIMFRTKNYSSNKINAPVRSTFRTQKRL